MESSVLRILLRRQFLGLEKRRLSDLARRAKEDLRREELELFKKRLLAPPVSDVDYDKFSAVDTALMERYHVPLERESHAWQIFTQQMKDGLGDQLKQRTTRLNVALVVGGGVGDVLKASNLIRRLARQFDAMVTMVTDQAVAIDVFKDNPYVQAVFRPTCNPHEFSEECLQHIPVFDLIVAWKYAVYFHIPPKSRLSADDKHRLLASRTVHGGYLEKHTKYNDVWPVYNFGLFRYLSQNKMHIIDIALETSGLTSDADQSIDLFLQKKDFWLAEECLTRPYVTVHHGFDTGFLPQTSRPNDYDSTKNIALEKWAEIVVGLRELGLDVVQLGIAAEQKIPGITYCLNGLTNIAETAAIQKGAICHVDTEGGLVHLAHAVHTQSVVLFGPTPVSVFGYDRNINIEPVGCRACAYSTENWVVQCPRFTAGPDCMDEHSPKDVVSAVKQIVSAQSRIKCNIVSFSSVSVDLTMTTIESVTQSEVTGKRQVVVVVDSESYLLLDRALPEIRLDSRILVNQTRADVEAMVPEVSRQFEYCSYCNLSIPDSLVDKIILVGDLEKIDIAYALRESIRVLASGGKIELISTGWFTQATLCNSLAKWGIPLSGGADEAVGYRAVLTIEKSELTGLKTPEVIEQGNSDTALITAIEDDPTHDGNARALEAAFAEIELKRKLSSEAWKIADQLTYTLRPYGWISLASYLGFKFLLEGWHGPEEWGVWSKAPCAEIQIPIPCPDIRGDDIFAKIELDVVMPDSPHRKASRVRVLSGGDILGSMVVPINGILIVEVAGQYIQDIGLLGLTLEVEALYRVGDDNRDLGVGLKRIRVTLLPEKKRVRRIPDGSAAINQLAHELQAAGWTDIISDLGSQLLLHGWHGHEDWGVWSKVQSAKIQIPVPCPLLRDDYIIATIMLEVIMPDVPERHERMVRVLSGGEILKYVMVLDNAIIRLEVPAKHVQKDGILELSLDVDGVLKVGDDPRNLGVGLKRIRVMFSED